MTTDLTLATLAARINNEHAAAEGALNTALHHARRAGELLTQAKAQVGHGGWGAWLGEHFRGSERTAQAYMRVAGRWPELEAQANPQRVSDSLPLREALALLAEPRDVDADAVDVARRRIADAKREAAGGGAAA